MFWSNSPSLLEQKLVLEQLFWSKSLFWSNASSLLEQKLVLEQHSTTFGEKHVLEQPSITFGAKYCFGATLHHFLSKRLFWSNASSLLVQKLVLEQHSIAFQTKKDEVIWGPVRSGPSGPSVLGPRHWSCNPGWPLHSVKSRMWQKVSQKSILCRQQQSIKSV